ncbi:protein containing N-acetylmuramoyl-L-alanine amidase, family 2 domain protein, partial [human gut metagenome]
MQMQKHARRRIFYRWHLANGWAGAGYHFLVRKDGTIYRLRPEDKVGAHAYGSNYNSIGV